MLVKELTPIRYPSFATLYKQVFPNNDNIPVLPKKNRIVFIHERDENVISFLLIRWIQCSVDILDVGVEEISRGKGLGESLFKHFFTWAKERRVKQAYLEVSANNQPAVSFYNKLGFEVIRTRDGYYADGSQAVVFRKVL